VTLQFACFAARIQDIGMRPPTILVVDDTQEVRSLVARVLESQGYSVLEAGDGPHALVVCHNLSGQIDLLVTDVKMPGMDGVELARSVRAGYPTIRVLYISGQCEGDELQAHLCQKGFGFLSKPFLPQALIEAVEQILMPAKGPASLQTNSNKKSA
jgi:CheY-like chemotaxis protein